VSRFAELQREQRVLIVLDYQFLSYRSELSTFLAGGTDLKDLKLGSNSQLISKKRKLGKPFPPNPNEAEYSTSFRHK